MTSGGADQDDRPGVRGDTAPLGHAGPSWDGRAQASAGDSHVAAIPAAVTAAAPPLGDEAEPVILVAPGVLRIAGQERALAGIPARVAAYILDLLTIWVGLVIIAAVVGGDMEAPDPGSPEFNEAASQVYLIGVGFQVVFYWVWNSLGWSPGKRLFGLRIVTHRGVAPRAGRGFVRTVGPMLAGAVSGVLIVVLSLVLPPTPALLLGLTPAYLNYLWPLWDTRRQTWHDKLASTFVVKAEAAASETSS